MRILSRAHLFISKTIGHDRFHVDRNDNSDIDEILYVALIRQISPLIRRINSTNLPISSITLSEFVILPLVLSLIEIII